MASHDIIIIGADPWEHYTWRRRHHVTWNLARDNRVLYIAPPLNLLNPLIDLDLNWRHFRNLGRFKYQGRNLYTYSPVRLLPLSLPGAERYNFYERDKKRIFKKLKKIVKKLQFNNPILWVYYNSYQYDYFGLFNEKIRVADWFDKLTAYVGYDLSEKRISQIRDRELRIIENADIIFTASEELKKEIRSFSDNVHVFPHGVDYDLFELNHDSRKNISKKAKGIKSPALGFIGIMHYRVDFDLLSYVAEKRPDWSILLIGKKWLTTESEKMLFNDLINKDNVHYLGEKPRTELPIYLSAVDVCLMPLKLIEFNNYSAPLKLWEYLAAGKPIVAVDRGVRYDCEEFIKLAKDKEEFVQKIDECLKNRVGEEVIKKMKQVAKDNSWEKRVGQMMSLIESHLDFQN